MNMPSDVAATIDACDVRVVDAERVEAVRASMPAGDLLEELAEGGF